MQGVDLLALRMASSRDAGVLRFFLGVGLVRGVGFRAAEHAGNGSTQRR